MSENSTVDILQPLPVEKWHLLQEKTKHKWPLFAYYHYWVENSIKWKKIDPNIDVAIYCPYGNYEKGTFVAINSFATCMVLIFTLDPNGENISKILTETKVIDWSRPLQLATVHQTIAPVVLSALEDLKRLKNVEAHVMPFNYYFKSAEDSAKAEICVPGECYLKPLDESDIELIHSVWPHRDPEHPEVSLKYLHTIRAMNGGLGLYLKEDNSLVSWVMQNDWHGLAIVQTVERHKRKGYAKVVVKALAKRLGEQGIPTNLFIVEGNAASEKMFQNLGWKAISPFVWIQCKKLKIVDPNN